MALEYAVRPYQSPGSLGKTIIPSTPGSTTARATLTWGADATMPTVVPAGTNVSCCNEQLGETSRETENVRIIGNKPENWIDVARSKSVKLKKETKSNCAGDWDQFSGVAAEISSTMAGLSSAIHASDSAFGTGTDGNCDVKWELNNNTAAP